MVAAKSMNRYSTIRNQLTRRSGITILEVLFATVVAVVGILGIASILPLAARNARESNSYNFVQNAAPGWFQEISTRGLNSYGSWRALDDIAPGYGFAGLAKLPTPPVTPSGSTVTSQQVNRIWPQQSICLDPYFFTDREVQKTITTAVSAGTAPSLLAYRPSVFPFYQEGYNPATDSYAPTTSASWQDQPRMIRVTLDSPLMTAIAPALRQVNRQYVDNLFTASDDYVEFIDKKDATASGTRTFSSLTNPPTLTVGKAISERKYSWLATMTPVESASLTPQSEYNLSIVVFNKRDMKWIDATDIVPRVKENKPSGERLVWVYPLSGDFLGGNGGRVRLISNANASDRLYIGDWIMLAKHWNIPPAFPLNRFPRFKWYRIVAMDAEPTYGKLGDTNIAAGNDPYGSSATEDVWARDVVLDGPDWDFAPASGGVITPTTGALLKNVITVIDRTVNIP
jgi:hypothetical protein